MASALGIVVDSVCRAAPERVAVAAAAGNTGVSRREDLPVNLHLFYACVAHLYIYIYIYLHFAYFV